ncbi:hypothetical protein [Nocardia lijiangensis]|uniref:hypothetical protein n=1 Tax=Nocardia lijiangensis TaxID=299618 RepID=UPI003D75BFE5
MPPELIRFVKVLYDELYYDWPGIVTGMLKDGVEYGDPGVVGRVKEQFVKFLHERPVSSFDVYEISGFGEFDTDDEMYEYFAEAFDEIFAEFPGEKM